MHVLILVPRQPLATGNHITAARYRAGLLRLGHQVRITEVALEEPVSLEDPLPDLVHLLHAYRTGRPFLGAELQRRSPSVVTLTGTDIYGGIDNPEEGPLIHRVLEQAAAIITQNPLTCSELRNSPYFWRDKLHYLPPGIVPGTIPLPLRQTFGIPESAVLFLHPAGIRPVKRNLELLQLFDQVARRGEVRLAFCGPQLDADYADRFFTALRQRPWASYLGVIEPQAMAAALRETDVILNHSLCEGMSNVLIEAASLGRPILARRIPGNAAVVEDGINGLLYGDDADFVHQAQRLLGDADLRLGLSHPSPQRFSPDKETAGLAEIYRKVLSSSRLCCRR